MVVRVDDYVVLAGTLLAAVFGYFILKRGDSSDFPDPLFVSAPLATLFALSHAVGLVLPGDDGRLGGLLGEVFVLGIAVYQRRSEGRPVRSSFAVWVLGWGSFACLMASLERLAI